MFVHIFLVQRWTKITKSCFSLKINAMKIIVFGANSPTAQFMIQQLASTKSVEIYGLIRSNPEELFQNASVSYLTYAISQLEKSDPKLRQLMCGFPLLGRLGYSRHEK